MSATTYRKVFDVIRFIERELERLGTSSPGGSTLVRYMNEAIRQLAKDAAAFRRWELIKTLDSTAEYQLAQVPEKIHRISYEGTALIYQSQEELNHDPNRTDWRTEEGTPTRWTGDDRIRLTPIPSADGDAFTFSEATKLTAEEGYTITGHGYVLAFNSGAEVFFKPGDGTVANEETADGRLLVEYSYVPDSVDTDTLVPNRFIRALEAYVLARATGGAMDTWQAEKATFQTASIDPKWEFRHYEAVQQALATGGPLPKLLADDYERIVSMALRDGDPTGRDYILSKGFLMQAVQAAIVEGKPVPAEIRTAYDRYVHDLEPHAAELQAALPWSFCEREIQRCVSEGVPISEVVMASYLARQPITEAGPTSRDLTNETIGIGGSSSSSTTYSWGD